MCDKPDLIYLDECKELTEEDWKQMLAYFDKKEDGDASK